MPEDLKQTAPVAPVTEQATPETAPTAPDKLAQLAQKEKAMWRQIKQFKKERAEWEAQKKAPPATPVDDWKGRLKTDFLGAVTEAGLSFEDVSAALLNSRPEDMQMRQLRAEMAEIKAASQSAISQAEASQKKAYDQAVKQLSREVKLLVDSDETFETIKATNSQDAVVALIESTYNEDGILMTAGEAAKQVEDYLTEEALSLAKLKKIQAKLTPVVPAEPEQKTTPQKKTTTLTHSTVPASSTGMSAKDRRARAIAAFQNNLK